MSRAERRLRFLLRFEAIVVAFALPAAVMPTPWMNAIHLAMGLGDLPRAPIVEYLTRTISLLYVAWAPLLWFVSADLRRYLPLVWLICWLTLLGSFLFPLIDLLVGMPLPWTICEGAILFAYALGGLLLTRAVQQEAALEDRCSPP